MSVFRTRVFSCACVLLAGCAGGPAREMRPEPPLRMNATENVDEQLVDAHNRLRARRGLPPVEPSPALAAAADRHARDMAAHRRMRHRGSDGTSPFQRMSQEGYTFDRAGENVAYGQPDVEAVMDAWWRSLPHRANILDSFSQIGTGTATDEDGTPYWCVTFGKPSSP